MKTITKTELDTLKEYLGTKPFRYEEVYNEVIDHYATAYEQSELGLYDVIREQDKHFTDKKIREIDQLFIKDVKRQLYKAHLGLFVGYFKWPQFLMTLGVSLLFFLAGPIFFNYQIVAQTLFVAFCIVPYIFMFYIIIVSRKQDRKLPGKIVNGKLSQVGRLGIFVMLYLVIDRMYLRVLSNPADSILEDNMFLTSFVLLLGFAICWSSYQLFRLKFKPAIL